jgi:hypothetical protein
MAHVTHASPPGHRDSAAAREYLAGTSMLSVTYGELLAVNVILGP